MCKENEASSKDIRMFVKTAWEKGKVAIMDDLTDFMIKAEDYISKNGKTLIMAAIFCGLCYASGKKKGRRKAKKDLVNYFENNDFTNGVDTYRVHIKSFGNL